MNIKKAPTILILHLKRFNFTGLDSNKINDKIQYDEDLNLSPFMLEANVYYNIIYYKISFFLNYIIKPLKPIFNDIYIILIFL